MFNVFLFVLFQQFIYQIRAYQEGLICMKLFLDFFFIIVVH
jgi:hypothetical protein